MAVSQNPHPDLIPHLRTLITASHILHYYNICDAYGHVSLRSPLNPNTFFISHAIAPANVSSPRDLVEYHVSDASPVDPSAPAGYLERNIHAGIYRQYSGVNCVVHGHSPELVSFSIAGVPFRAVNHMSGFIGTATPNFDSRHHRTATDPNDLLIRTTALGDALSTHFSAPPSSAPKEKPDAALVLMRGHGFTTAADTIPTAVYQAVYAQVNARIIMGAVNLRSGLRGNRDGGDTAGVAEQAMDEIDGLSEEEVKDTWKSNLGTQSRPWGLWEREVANSRLYRNELVDK
ncbi:MAG: hypothetical protein Q9227_001435 [Pyrenula ochraceoflavens]